MYDRNHLNGMTETTPNNLLVKKEKSELKLPK